MQSCPDRSNQLNRNQKSENNHSRDILRRRRIRLNMNKISPLKAAPLKKVSTAIQFSVTLNSSARVWANRLSSPLPDTRLGSALCRVTVSPCARMAPWSRWILSVPCPSLFIPFRLLLREYSATPSSVSPYLLCVSLLEKDVRPGKVLAAFRAGLPPAISHCGRKDGSALSGTISASTATTRCGI